jgi:hypothetical protein
LRQVFNSKLGRFAILPVKCPTYIQPILELTKVSFCHLQFVYGYSPITYFT